MLIEQGELLKQLRENVISVTFTKKNGDERVMKCTLIRKHLPEFPDKDPDAPVKPKPTDRVAVFDVEAEGFRSIILESITSVDCT